MANTVGHDDRRLSRKALLHLMPVVGALGLVAFYDRISVSFAGPQGMNAELGLSATAFGFAVGIFTVGYVIFEVPTAPFLAKLGTRRWILRILLTWGVIQCATAFVPNAELLYVCRFLLGVAEAGFMPAIFYFISAWFIGSYRALAFMLLGGTMSLGNIVGPIVASWLIQLGNSLPTGAHLSGWRFLLLVVGIMALLCAIPTFYKLVETPADASWLTDEDKRRYQELLDEDIAEASPTVMSVGQVIRSWQPWFIGLGYFAISYAAFLIYFWTPTIVLGFQKQFATSFGPHQSALIAGIPTLVGVVIAFVIAQLAGRTGRIGLYVAGAALVGITGGVVAAFADGPMMLVAGLCLIAVAGQSGIFVPSMLTRIFGGAGAFSAIAIVNSMGAAAGFFSPVITGLLVDASGTMTASFYFLGGVLVVAAVIAVLTERMARQRTPVTALDTLPIAG
jgi:MFS family permease